MKNKAIIISMFLLAAVSCNKDRNPQPTMGWTAQNAVDKICGVYLLDSVEWNGQPVDLDGDGMADPSLMKELLSGRWDGIQAPCTARIEPAYKLDKPTQIKVYVYFGSSFNQYEMSSIDFFYTVNVNGEFSFQPSQQAIMRIQVNGNEIESIRSFDKIEARMEGDLFVVMGDTAFYDVSTEKSVPGRETLRYKCISTKQKK